MRAATRARGRRSMSSDHRLQIDLLERIQNFVVDCECNELTDDHWTDFERLLRENDDACRAYAQYMGVSALLQSVMDTTPDEDSVSPDVICVEPPAPTFLSTTFHNTIGYLSEG